MRYKLAIFDMDGTILDTLEDLKNSTNAALAHFGYPQRTLDEVRTFVGNGMENLIRRAAPEGLSREELEPCLYWFKQHYAEHAREHTRPYEGILPLLRHLKKEGMRLAVVSNKGDFAVQDLCRYYFPGLFDFAAGEREGIRRKPAPDVVLSVLDELQCRAEEAVYIGDSDVDSATAGNANMDCILVAWGFRPASMLQELQPVKLVRSPEEIEKFLSLEMKSDTGAVARM